MTPQKSACIVSGISAMEEMTRSCRCYVEFKTKTLLVNDIHKETRQDTSFTVTAPWSTNTPGKIHI